MSRLKNPGTPPVIAAIKEAHKGDVYRILRLGKEKTPNILSIYGFNEVDGASGLYPASYAELLSALQSRFDSKNQIIFGNYVFLSSYDSPILDMLNVRYIITHPDPLEQNSLLPEIANIDGYRVYEKKTCCPRFFIVSQFTCANHTRIKELILSPAFKPDTVAFLEKEPLFPIKKGEPVSESVTIVSLKTDIAIVDVKLFKNSILVFSDNYYPGWHAIVDGKPVELLRVNYILKGVALSPGSHKVHFYYRPTYLSLSLILACSALLLLIITAITSIFGNKKKTQDREPTSSSPTVRQNDIFPDT
jgi:hypothetical protein